MIVRPPTVRLRILPFAVKTHRIRSVRLISISGILLPIEPQPNTPEIQIEGVIIAVENPIYVSEIYNIALFFIPVTDNIGAAAQNKNGKNSIAAWNESESLGVSAAMGKGAIVIRAKMMEVFTRSLPGAIAVSMI
jgi:hypothetical protein